MRDEAIYLFALLAALLIILGLAFIVVRGGDCKHPYAETITEELGNGSQREYLLLDTNGAYTVKQGGQSCDVYVHVVGGG